MPFEEELGRTGTVPPAQIVSVVPKPKVGVMFGATVTLNVTGGAQVPAVGVKVYVFEFWLSTVAGLHVPFILLLEVVGSVGTLAPAHILSDGPKLNTGVITGLTVTVKIVVVAHCPVLGVNV